MAEYIEREKAFDAVFAQFCASSDETEAALNAAIEEISAIPASDVRPVVRGKWIPVTNGRGGHECSLCHEYAPSFQSGEEHLTNFCPNCGAMMEES